MFSRVHSSTFSANALPSYLWNCTILKLTGRIQISQIDISYSIMSNNTTKKKHFRHWFWPSASRPQSELRHTNPSGLLVPIDTPAPSTYPTPNPTPLLFPVWQRSLEIAQNRLSKEKLPPLELHTHSSQSANEIAQETMRDLQQVIDTNQNGHGTVARKVQDFFVVFNKYIGIVDVAIQHSPEITALVSGGIRGILQVCFQSTVYDSG